MKVKLRIANYIKFGKPEDIKIGDKIILYYNSNIKFLYMPPKKAWFKKILTIDHFISNNTFQIKGDYESWFWDKCWIKCNYSNYKFEVL